MLGIALFLLKDLRIELEMTQKQLANKININRVFLSKIERNELLPSYDLALKIARVLNCQYIDLFCNEDLELIGE